MPIDPPERADEAPSAESELIGQERKDTVRRVLAELPEKDQQVLKLLFYQDTPKDEVCRQFQVDRGYLRVLLYRAKKRFRELLEQTPISSARHETKRDYLSQGR
jgi:RNA polymerase sigma factor (sigma-70 family)